MPEKTHNPAREPGETDAPSTTLGGEKRRGPGLSDREMLRKDVHPASSSERDTATLQESGVNTSSTARESDVDEELVDVLPGTGGPDDVGTVEVDEDELNLDFRQPEADEDGTPAS